MYETETFNKSHDLKSKQQEVLFRKSATNFESFNSVRRKLKKSSVNDVKDNEQVYTELEDIYADRIKTKIGVKWEGNETEVLPVMLSEQKEYILLPKNAKILAYESGVKSFQFISVSKITEGDLLLLRDGDSSDFLSGIASLVVDDFDEFSTQAGAWRRALNEFTIHRGYSATALQRFISNATSINKTATTIRNWLNDGSIVAPDNFELILPKIGSLLGDYGFSFDVEKTIEAVKSIYRSRTVARDALNEYFTRSHFEEVSERKQINVELQDFNVNFHVKEVAAIAPIFTAPYSSTWQIEALK